MDVLATALAALASPGQHDRLLRLHTPLGRDVLVAETLHARESFDNGGFRLELTALSVDAHLSFDELLGQPVLLELLTADSRTDLRPFHGHVTACELLGGNGGLARYRLVIEPWLAFLRQRIDSYAFQDMSVVEIVEDVFADYVQAGALVPAWRWELGDRSLYRRRSLTTQYEECDYDFLQRLLADEGVYYWFEHAGAADDESLGCHTLVLCDHVDAFADAGRVRYHRNDVTEREDGIQQWQRVRRWQTGRLERASWDYRSLGTRPASAGGGVRGDVVPVDTDTAGPYAWVDGVQGELRARRQMEALQVRSHAIDGGGTWRRLAPGISFELSGHHAHRDADERRFNCVAVKHEARNNLGAEIHDALEQALGPVAAPGAGLPDALGGLEARRQSGQGEAELDRDRFYRNAFTVIPHGMAYRPITVDGHGLRLNPKPTVHGTQSAIVVSDGAPLLTDRDHRIRVQFHWQRGADSSSGTAHPGGDDNAPGNDGAWTWVRVATPWAGDNWGGVAIPRRGQEVLVAFLEGDIDRPVVVGTVYNGRGQDDAQHNQVAGGRAGATGNAVAWFDGNEHAAVYTGFKSQALASTQDGSGGYQLLRLDDTPGQGRAQAATTQHQSTLTLGHLKGGEDNVRGAERGFGAELSTLASGAIRAGSGLLLTTEPGSRQLAATQTLGQLGEGEQLVQALADTAGSQQATLPGDPDVLPAQESLQHLQQTLQATRQGQGAAGGDEAIGGGEGEVPAWSAPQLVASSPEGVVSLTPADQAWISGTQTTLAAGADLDWVSQAGTVVAAGGGVALFTQGSDGPVGKPNQETGIALHAAQGKVSARAHRNEAKVAAKQSVTIASTQADVEIAAPSKHVLLAAQGAYLKLEGGDIELGAPGVIEFKASHRELAGPGTASGRAPAFGEAEPKFCDYTARQAEADGAATVSMG